MTKAVRNNNEQQTTYPMVRRLDEGYRVVFVPGELTSFGFGVPTILNDVSVPSSAVHEISVFGVWLDAESLAGYLQDATIDLIPGLQILSEGWYLLPVSVTSATRQGASAEWTVVLANGAVLQDVQITVRYGQWYVVCVNIAHLLDLVEEIYEGAEVL